MKNMIVFLAGWYLFTIITYGTNVPSGLFLPGMIIGCALGDIYYDISKDYGFAQENMTMTKD